MVCDTAPIKCGINGEVFLVGELIVLVIGNTARLNNGRERGEKGVGETAPSKDVVGIGGLLGWLCFDGGRWG